MFSLVKASTRPPPHTRNCSRRRQRDRRRKWGSLWGTAQTCPWVEGITSRYQNDGQNIDIFVSRPKITKDKTEEFMTQLGRRIIKSTELGWCPGKWRVSYFTENHACNHSEMLIYHVWKTLSCPLNLDTTDHSSSAKVPQKSVSRLPQSPNTIPQPPQPPWPPGPQPPWPPGPLCPTPPVPPRGTAGVHHLAVMALGRRGTGLLQPGLWGTANQVHGQRGVDVMEGPAGLPGLGWAVHWEFVGEKSAWKIWGILSYQPRNMRIWMKWEVSWEPNVRDLAVSHHFGRTAAVQQQDSLPLGKCSEPRIQTIMEAHVRMPA